MKDLLIIVDHIGNDHVAARLLHITPEFIAQWRPRPRTLKNGKTIMGPGYEPSAGFIAACLAILRAA